MYDGSDQAVSCSIDDQNQGKVCTVCGQNSSFTHHLFDYNSFQLNTVLQLSFRFDEDVDGPLYVYYELENFYQNHRRYVSSRDAFQLEGMVSF